MNNKETAKTSTAKMLSLMERMENKGTYNQAMLTESRYLMEAARVNNDSLLQFLTKYNVKKGNFVSIGYIQVYETNTQYPTDDFYNAMDANRAGFNDLEGAERGAKRFDAHMDKMSNTEWNSPTGRGTSKGKPMANKLYPYVLKLTTYQVHWQSAQQFGEKYGEFEKQRNNLAGQMSQDLRDRMGITWNDPNLPNDDNEKRDAYRNIGDLGKYDVSTYSRKEDDGTINPISQEYYNDTTDMTPNNYDRTAIRNYLSDIKAQKPVYFGIDKNGDIDPIPKPLGRLIQKRSVSSFDNKIAALTDPQEIALTKQYSDLVKRNEMALKTWLTQNVAYICATVNEIGGTGASQSVYWINRQPLFLLNKAKDKGTKTRAPRDAYKYLLPKLNNEELESILDRFGKSEADELLAQANGNVQGETAWADPEDLTM